MDNFNLKQYLAENRFNIFSTPKYEKFMLEWFIPEKESSTMMSNNLRELFEYIQKNNLRKYTIKGWSNGKWDLLINTEG